MIEAIIIYDLRVRTSRVNVAKKLQRLLNSKFGTYSKFEKAIRTSFQLPKNSRMLFGNTPNYFLRNVENYLVLNISGYYHVK